jgi:hypothetical protein
MGRDHQAIVNEALTPLRKVGYRAVTSYTAVLKLANKLKSGMCAALPAYLCGSRLTSWDKRYSDQAWKALSAWQDQAQSNARHVVDQTFYSLAMDFHLGDHAKTRHPSSRPFLLLSEDH